MEQTFQSNLDATLAELNLTVQKRFERSKNNTYLVTNPEGKTLVLKSTENPERKPYMQNEVAWLKQAELLKSCGINIPRLIWDKDYGDRIFFITEFVDGENFEKKLEDGILQDNHIQFLANFCKVFEEELPFVESPNSIRKRDTTDEEFEKIFFENANKWKEELLSGLTSEAAKTALQKIFNSAKEFKIKTVGRGGLFGSSKLIEFIEQDKDFYVVDWEVASSSYINFYQTASILGYLVAQLGKTEIAKKFLEFRFAGQIPNGFKSVFAQRCLGDLTDVQRDKKANLDERVELVLGFISTTIF